MLQTSSARIKLTSAILSNVLDSTILSGLFLLAFEFNSHLGMSTEHFLTNIDREIRKQSAQCLACIESQETAV